MPGVPCMCVSKITQAPQGGEGEDACEDGKHRYERPDII